MFNRFVHMSKRLAVEKLVRLKTHVIDVMQFIELQCEALKASTTKKHNNIDGNKKHHYRATVLSAESSYCNYCRRGGHKM
ncbi:hypothetical protein FF38_13450 [Lucilia cuprina]|uniref:Uncharacterized protein n=1 Tax=Lucilia cuprina TaxID=7375 RepID=A0A0L0BPJ9_LUCCU|nr:hypothetical protein FF38_13450 [Lucilia cuprina]